jgi:hypothetical protein
MRSHIQYTLELSVEGKQEQTFLDALRLKKPGFYQICGRQRNIIVKNPVSEPPINSTQSVRLKP